MITIFELKVESDHHCHLLILVKYCCKFVQYIDYTSKCKRVQVSCNYMSCSYNHASALHPHDTMLSKVSGAIAMSVSNGSSVPSCERQPQSVGGRVLPIHS